MARKTNKLELKCQNCDKTYYLPPSKASRSKFCGRACKDENSTIHNTKANCLHCKKEFVVKKGKKYCARTCYMAANKKPRISRNMSICEFNRFRLN